MGITACGQSQTEKTEDTSSVVEEKPEYNPETQELYSWFENGDIITQKFKIIDKKEQ